MSCLLRLLAGQPAARRGASRSRRKRCRSPIARHARRERCRSRATRIEPLPPGAVVGVADRAQHRRSRGGRRRAAHRRCERLGTRPRRVALVIPDLAARVSLVRFEQVPARREDLEQLVRWQMRKSAPFPIEDACVTYSPGARQRGGREFVVVLARRDVDPRIRERLRRRRRLRRAGRPVDAERGQPVPGIGRGADRRLAGRAHAARLHLDWRSCAATI